MKKVVVYVRESTMKQVKKGYNLSEQKRILMDRVKFDYPDGVEIMVMEEKGESAKDLERTEMKKLLPMIAQRQVDAVYVISLDRLTRSVGDMAKLIDLFKVSKVDLVSYQENVNLDTPQGVFFCNLMSTIGQWEREAISHRTMRALEEAAVQKKYVKPKYPFGYQRDNGQKNTITFKEPEASFMREIFRQLDEEDITVTELSLKYDAERKFDRRWKDLYKMVKNPNYHGTMIVNGKEFPGIIPPLIDEETHARIISKIHTTKSFRQHNYLYKNLAYCSCGSRLKCTCTVSNKNGQVFIYYKCDDCKVYFNEKKIDELVTDQINKKIEQDEHERIMHSAKDKVTRKFNDLEHLMSAKNKDLIDDRLYDSERDRIEHEISVIASDTIYDRNNQSVQFNYMSDSERRNYLLKNVSKLILNKMNAKVKIVWKDKK